MKLFLQLSKCQKPQRQRDKEHSLYMEHCLILMNNTDGILVSINRYCITRETNRRRK